MLLWSALTRSQDIRVVLSVVALEGLHRGVPVAEAEDLLGQGGDLLVRHVHGGGVRRRRNAGVRGHLALPCEPVQRVSEVVRRAQLGPHRGVLHEREGPAEFPQARKGHHIRLHAFYSNQLEELVAELGGQDDHRYMFAQGPPNVACAVVCVVLGLRYDSGRPQHLSSVAHPGPNTDNTGGRPSREEHSPGWYAVAPQRPGGPRKSPQGLRQERCQVFLFFHI
mmetsp:Transcript_16917/g.49274  ORF Transcript_16917/g.49274 Transcript_16917/m.49274 type:complete len:223 (-) Transcript_16917:261-929(-)